MKLKFAVSALALLAAACAAQSPGSTAPEIAAPAADPVSALRPYYATLEASLPTAGPGAPLPAADAVLTRILFGSCNTAERDIPILDRAAADAPDLFVYLGDNVYGDTRGDMSLPELREQYALLASKPEFQRLRAAAPMLATWDDHDFGLNDAGGDFSAKEWAKTIFETFWGVGERTAAHDGVFDAYAFGPEGQRVQIILLDTRYARTQLARLPERGSMGPYTQSTDPNQRMLSDAQWAWLAAKLREPADVRIIASSIQVLADGHDFEAWETLPLEQARLFETIRESGASGVVMVSGDRHSAGLYRQDGLLPYPAYELTTSSLNMSFRSTSSERSTNQIGDMYAPINYGAVEIDWVGKTITLDVRDAEGQAVRRQVVAFADIGAG